MKAVYITEFGAGENLEFRDVPDPGPPTQGKVLVKVRAAGLNRADLLQRRGGYPPPEGYSPNIPGLEIAGEVIAVADGVKDLKPGDRVFGIVAGEGQAEQIAVDARCLAHIPENLSFVEAAAIPEAFITAYDAIFSQAHLKSGETLLIHAVGSGVGLAALQLAKSAVATVIGTSRTTKKLSGAAQFGLDHGVVTVGTDGFYEDVAVATEGRGADVILDLVGSAYLQANLQSLASKGRLLLVGLPSGRMAEFDLGVALQRRATIIGTVLRTRSADEKAEVTLAFSQNVVPLLRDGSISPNLDEVFPATAALAAYDKLASNATFGKVVLEF